MEVLLGILLILTIAAIGGVVGAIITLWCAIRWADDQISEAEMQREEEKKTLV